MRNLGVNQVKILIFDFLYSFTNEKNGLRFSTFKFSKYLFWGIDHYWQYWITIIFICLLFYLIKWRVVSYYDDIIYDYYKNTVITTFKKILLDGIIRDIISILVYLLPIVIFIFPFINSFCVCGVEFFGNANLPNNDMSELYSSCINDSSGLLAFTTAFCILLSIWNNQYLGNGFSYNCLIIYPLCIGCIIICNGINFVLLIMSVIALPSAIKNINSPSLTDEIALSFEYTNKDKERLWKRELQPKRMMALVIDIILFIACFVYVYFIFPIPEFNMP